MNTMTYKGYAAKIEYSDEDQCLIGHIAGIRDVIGGRSGAYEKTLREARQVAIDELMLEAQALGADAVVGVSIDFEGGVHQGTMMMVAASGTAVRLG